MRRSHDIRSELLETRIPAARSKVKFRRLIRIRKGKSQRSSIVAVDTLIDYPHGNVSERSDGDIARTQGSVGNARPNHSWDLVILVFVSMATNQPACTFVGMLLLDATSE
jgi:hypothetical protein